MVSVEMRWNNGVLEFRSLIIRERSIYVGSEPHRDELYVDWENSHTEWAAVPVKD